MVTNSINISMRLNVWKMVNALEFNRGRIMKRMIHVAKGTVCPLCPDHFDDEKDFVWSNLLKAPICWPCTYEIFNGFIGFDEAPTKDQYNCADSMKKMIDENVSREESFKDFEKRICEFKSEMEKTAMIMSDGAVKR